MQAITTKYIGPTDFRGSRIQARCTAKTIYVPYDDALSREENHVAAAQLLKTQLNWSGDLASGTLHDGSFAHVFKSWPVLTMAR